LVGYFASGLHDLIVIIVSIVAAWAFSNSIVISDYQARRSIKSTKRLITKLEHRLHVYENYVEDTNRFFGRLIIEAVVVITCGLCIVLITLINNFNHMERLIESLPSSNVHTDTTWQEIESLFYLVLVAAFTFRYGFWFNKLISECFPNAHRRRLSERIARLRSRLPVEAPDS
jgi:hypothetical protein